MVVAEKISIDKLKALIVGLEGERQRRDSLRSSDLAGGVPRGAVVEVTGAKRTEWVVRLLAENPEANVAWVESSLSVLPSAIEQREGGLARILFVEAEQEVDWALRTVLRSGLFGAVVAAGDIRSDRRLRRYQIFAEQSNTSLLLLSESPSPAWCISLQVEASAPQGDLLATLAGARNTRPAVKLLKRKG